MSLFWRVFAANAAVMTVGLLILMLTPISVSRTVTVPEALDLCGGLIVLLAVNLILLRSLLRPLPRLVRYMQGVDVLRAGGRVAADSPGEIGALERAFNEMLDRLEAERRQSGSRVLTAQEAERQRIARGLHDEIGQTMTGVLFQLNRLARTADRDQRAEISEAQAAVRTSLEDVRRMAQELRPETLDHLGLAKAIRSLASGFQTRTGIAVKLDLGSELPSLDSEAELTLYRVAQESLTNVARHSGAGEVLVSLRAGAMDGRDARSVILRIADDGRGFVNGTADGGGLRGIRERALIADAALAIKPSSAGGVEIRLEVPTTPSVRRA
jgi:two-component system, NarL family, sensor histidine kinase UhpB